MNWWTEIRHAVMLFLDHHGLLAACIALFIEEAGVPLPFFPGDGVMMLLGVRARQGRIPLWQVVVALEVMTLLGSSLLYALSRRAGRDLLHRYGRVLHLTPARLARAEHWLQRHGVLAVVVARLVPGFRIAGAVACGVLAVPFRVFFAGTAVGALLSILLFVLLGYFLGPSALALVERVHFPLELVVSCLTLAVVGTWVVRARQTLYRDPFARAEAARPTGRLERVRSGLAAGAAATLVSTVLMNVLVHLAGTVALLSPGTLVEFAVRRLPRVLDRSGHPLLLLVAVPAFVATGLLWGAVYGGFVEWYLRRYRLPDWVKGALFAVIPLTFALLLVLPTVGPGFPGAGTPALASLSEAIRHLVYGIILSLTFPVFLTRHLGRAAVSHGPGPAPGPARESPQGVQALPGPEEVGVGADRDAAPSASR